MKARLVSDLHIDVNRDGNFGFRHKECDVLFIAGDIAGDYRREEKFLNGLATDLTCPIFVVAGNHLGYDYYKNQALEGLWEIKPNPLDGEKLWSIKHIKKNVPENVHYLDNDYVELENYIVFGGCMYSDYKLYPNEDLSKRSGEMYLNDFRYVRIHDKKLNVVRPINTDDYQNLHKKFVQKLKKCIKETDKDIIVLSHFAPSIQSISDKYLDQGNVYLNASYASNMENFILQNERIKYWHHGHVHDSFDYMIGQCRVICSPYGYSGREQKISPKKWYGKEIEI